VVLPDSPDWPALAARFSLNGTQGANRRDRRAIIVMEADRIADSCGYAVPRMELTEERDLLEQLAERKSPEEITAYRAEKNAVSIDGLPSLG